MRRPAHSLVVGDLITTDDGPLVVRSWAHGHHRNVSVVAADIAGRERTLRFGWHEQVPLAPSRVLAGAA